MTLTPSFDAALAKTEMTALVDEVRAVTRKLSRDQILDLADVLHEVIRERQFEERSWRRLHPDVVNDQH